MGNSQNYRIFASTNKNLMKPLILISNDDGYHAGGIKTLVSFLKDWCDVLVVAPESARSGFSCGFSAAMPLRLKKRHNMGDVTVWSCNGTPVDCIKLALNELCIDRKPDLILGGINHGDNSSTNNHYSGTMGIAKEGCIDGYDSIAFSSCDYNEDANLSYLHDDVVRIVKYVLDNHLPKGTCLNVNFPKDYPFKGTRVCRMAFGRWINEVVKARHPHGYDYYWMAGEYSCEEPKAEDTDRWALDNGYVAITPTRIDVTDNELKATLENGLAL